MDEAWLHFKRHDYVICKFIALVSFLSILHRDLSENEIETVHPDTFLPLAEVQDV